ncbi:MAG: transglutaminase domain-containing protein [Nitrospirae bacterium]|nr:transglutaminase domain-containing protein [Nitrospirota bacterium]
MERGYRGCVQLYRFVLSAAYFIFLFIPFLAEAFEPDLEKELQQSLIQSRAIVLQARQKLNNSPAIDIEISKLKDISESVKISLALLQERFRLRQEAANQLGAKAGQRHRAMEEGYLNAIGEYLNLSEQLSAISGQLFSAQQSATPPLTSPLGKGGQREVIETLKTLLDKILPKNRRPIHGSLPYKNLNYPAREPDASPAIKPAYKGGSQTVSPDDTKDTPGAPLSLEIATLAQSLNWKPVAIYEYVKNNIETEWYWGCMKGAEETLRQRSGNDCDQATLLAAMLRASGFPTRYVRGTIEFFPDIQKAKNLTGIEDPLKMAEFFQKAGIPYKPVIQGGKITNLQIEHIWIESRIPYGNYRGTMIDDSDPTWLGLDTSKAAACFEDKRRDGGGW